MRSSSGVAKQNNRVAQRLANLERAVAALRAEADGSPMPARYSHLSPAKFAASQGYGRSWGRALISNGEIAAVTIGGRTRIPLDAAVRWIENELANQQE